MKPIEPSNLLNRKQTEAYIIELVTALTGNTDNADLYKSYFKQIDDQAFATWMRSFERGEEWLSITAPPYNAEYLKTERSLALAKELGIPIYTELDVSDDELGIDYKTQKGLVIYLPVRRMSQIGSGKISVAENADKVDSLTGQVTGDSQAAAVSYPEFMILSSSGVETALIELIAIRGGDTGALEAMAGLLAEYGTASMDSVQQHATGVESTGTMLTFLKCMHLRANI